MHCTNVRIVGIMWISFAKLLKMLLSYAKNWGKTQRSKNHFDHIKQATRRTVLLATKTPIKSKSNKILPKKTPMAPWEHREVQATKISFLGGVWCSKGPENQKKCWVTKATENLKEEIHWTFDDFACVFKKLACSQQKFWFVKPPNPSKCMSTVHTQTANNLKYSTPSTTSQQHRYQHQQQQEHQQEQTRRATTFPHRPSDTKSPLRSKRSRSSAKLNQRLPPWPNPWPGSRNHRVEGGPSMWVLPEFIQDNSHKHSWFTWGLTFIHIFILFFSRNPYPKFIMEMSNACYPSCTHPVAPVGTNIIIHQARLKEFSTHTPIQL